MGEAGKVKVAEQGHSNTLQQYAMVLRQCMAELSTREQQAVRAASRSTRRSAILGFLLALVGSGWLLVSGQLLDLNLELAGKISAVTATLLGLYLAWTNTKHNPVDQLQKAQACNQLSKGVFGLLSDIELDQRNHFSEKGFRDLISNYRERIDELNKQLQYRHIGVSICADLLKLRGGTLAAPTRSADMGTEGGLEARLLSGA